MSQRTHNPSYPTATDGASGDGTTARRRNQRGQGGLLREEVLAAAIRLLDRSSAVDLSLRTIAKEVGVAAPSLYSQFADAGAVLEHVARECWRQLAEAMDETQEAAADTIPLERLQSRMAGYVRYAMDRPSRYQLLFGVLVDTRAPERGPLRPVFEGVLGDVKACGHANGGYAALEPNNAALQILALTHGRMALAHLAMHDPANSAAAIESFVRDAVARLLR